MPEGYKYGGFQPNKYTLHKANGSPVNPKGEYLVLRLDADPHALKAAFAYCNSVKKDNRRFAFELRQRLLAIEMRIK